MKRSALFRLFCLSLLLLLAACRGEQDRPPAATATPAPAATDTPTPSAARGEEPDAESATSAPATEAAVEDTAGEREIVYTIPFEVRPDGFGFRNYGPGYPEGDFTIAELRELFGDGVCSRVDGDVCIPSAEAQQWIDDRNADMTAGHCIGFTVTSYRFAEGALRPAEFAPAADTPYDIPQQPDIMRAIALNGSLYWVKSVWSSEVSGTPRDIIDALIALGEPVDLSIFLPGLVGGHSLLAYGVEEVAPGQYHILVYDNNYPGEEAFVEVDYEANTWRYDQGAVNPDQKAIPYEGDAMTQTLRFIPLSAYETAACPFCPPDLDGEAVEVGEPITLISFLGQGEMLIETALGTIGAVAGEIINDIPGARLILPRGQLAAYDVPDVALPSGTDFTVEFSDLERVSSMSPELSLVIDRLTPGRAGNRLEVSPDERNVEFQAGEEQSPTLSVTIQQGDTSYQATLLGVDFAAGQGLALGASKEGDGLELRSRDIDVADATLLLTRLTDEDEAIFATTSLNIGKDGGVTLDIGQWDGSGGIDVFTDEDGDGAYDEQPAELTNEPLGEVLQGSDAGDAGSIIDALGPFLGEQGLEAILASLAEGELSGREIGEILFPLQLTDEQLIAVIPPLELPVPEVGELLFALRLETERVETVSAGLELEEADEVTLRTYLDDLALLHAILADWAFLNTDDMTQLITLLRTRNLTAEQLTRLLPRMGLDESEIEQVLGEMELSAGELAQVAEELGVDVPPTRTPTPTPAAGQTVTITVTMTPAFTGTVSLTPTPVVSATSVLSATATLAAGGTPPGTPTPDPYPGALPTPTDTPDPYPYPGPTEDPDPYPGPSATPDFDSQAFCVGDDLRVVAEEPTWEEGTIIEIWGGDDLLFTGEIGPDGEPLEVTLTGPGTWEDLTIEASAAPERVPLGTVTCPLQE